MGKRLAHPLYHRTQFACTPVRRGFSPRLLEYVAEAFRQANQHSPEADSMDSTRMVQSTGGSGAAVRAALKPTNDIRNATSAPRIPSEKIAEIPSLKPAGYGLPCAKCKTYYLANLNACPVCKSSERVSPVAVAAQGRPVVESQSDGGVLDEERERFLREFKAKLYAAHMQINPSAQLRCTFADERGGAHEGATVCKGCYDQLQTQHDHCEAALHMDVKEAAQVIYDAVWADTSDSNKTYLNAAQALLGVLRQRAGIKTIGGRHQPLPH
jgi:hypothetical protein